MSYYIPYTYPMYVKVIVKVETRRPLQVVILKTVIFNRKMI